MQKEFIMIEKDIFNKMLGHISLLEKHIGMLCDKYTTSALSKPLTTENVCSILSISPKTLQKYRDAGKIGFSRVGRIFFYQDDDVQALLESNSYKK